MKETNECLVRVTSPIRKVQQAVKKCQGSENQVKEMHDSITSKKDEYNNITDKLQVRQLFTVELIQFINLGKWKQYLFSNFSNCPIYIIRAFNSQNKSELDTASSTLYIYINRMT